MARIKLGGLVTDISGSIGSTTLQRGQFGAIARNKPKGRKAATQSQSEIRAMMAQVHYAWRNLSEARREEWRRYIDFTSPTIRRDSGVLLTGHALFIKYNMLRLVNGLAILTALTYPEIPNFPLLDQIEKDAPNSYMLELTSDPTAAGLSQVLKMSTPRPSGWRFRNAGLKALRGLTFAGDMVDIYPEYIAALNTELDTGDVVHVELQWFLLSAPILSQRYEVVTTIV